MRFALLVPLAVGLAAAHPTAAGPDEATDDAAVREAVKTYHAASNAADWQRIWDLVSADSRAIWGGERSRFIEGHARGSEQHEAIARRTTRSIDAVRIDGDRAEVDVRVRAPLLRSVTELRKGLPVPDVDEARLVERRITRVLLREDGAWKVEHRASPPPRDAETRAE